MVGAAADHAAVRGAGSVAASGSCAVVVRAGSAFRGVAVALVAHVSGLSVVDVAAVLAVAAVLVAVANGWARLCARRVLSVFQCPSTASQGS